MISRNRNGLICRCDPFINHLIGIRLCLYQVLVGLVTVTAKSWIRSNVLLEMLLEPKLIILSSWLKLMRVVFFSSFSLIRFSYLLLFTFRLAQNFLSSSYERSPSTFKIFHDFFSFFMKSQLSFEFPLVIKISLEDTETDTNESGTTKQIESGSSGIFQFLENRNHLN